MDFQQARFNMVEQQIRTWEVLDQAVLDALFEVPREHFVPDAYRQLAFSDIRIPLGLGQAMMYPRVEARMLQALNPGPRDRALEIGTGSGYVTALLAHFASSVVSIEIHAAFTDGAAKKLRSRDVTNVALVNADGVRGYPAQGPYDVIAVTGSFARRQPAIEAQLTIGGRLFVVLGNGPAMEAVLVTRTAEQAWTAESLFETELEPLIGAETPPQFVF
ncbi:MAG: protein-L-isoaspartate O-methyltransferase [Gammaproteobacteria bacterium]|nr:protein-L-isoaspartate O-methyltransferase [Gammaproteobacteria bacterium]